MEEEDARADLCEGTLWSTNPVEFSTDPEFHEKNIISKFWGPTTLTPDWTDRVNLICMCIIDIDPGAEGIDIPGEICEFGDYGVVITNLDEFFKRVKNAVGQMNGYDVRMRHVKYSDTPPADLSDIGIVFHKREHYKNEHEYRIAVQV